MPVKSRYRVRSTFRSFNDRLRRRAGHGELRGAQSPADELPLRGELFSVSQLEEHARELAGWHDVRGAAIRQQPDRLLPRLRANERVLRDAYNVVTEAVKRGRRITPAAEWFIDNYHLIEEQIRTARRHLPRTYNRELPRLANGPVPATPRVYHLALELISHAHQRPELVRDARQLVHRHERHDVLSLVLSLSESKLTSPAPEPHLHLPHPPVGPCS